MSAKSVKGPGGKKPASAATNLIGMIAQNIRTYSKNGATFDSYQQPAVELG